MHDRGTIPPWSSGPSSVLHRRGGWRDFVLRAGPGRIVNAMGRTLLYGMGGVAWSDVHTHVGIGSVPFLSGNATHTGWIAGFGFEYALSSHVSTRIEYAHIDLGSETHNLAFVGGGGGPTIPDKVDLKLDTIRLGVNVKLY